MTFQPKRPAAARHFFAAVLLCSLACSCRQTAPDPKAALIASLHGADAGGYLFGLKEDEAQTTASLTNHLANDPITLRKADTGLVLSYTRMEDNKTKAARIYKTEINRTASSLNLLVTDVGSGKVVENRQRQLSSPDLGYCDGQQTFATLSDCADAIYCSTAGALQCEANRTCQILLGGQTCCLKNGEIIDATIVASPNTLRCATAQFIGGANRLLVAVQRN